MLICLSPNGRNSYTGEERVTRMLVGTANGVSIVERVAGGWRGADLKLPGLHVSSLLVEPVRGGIFAGMHFGKGLYFSPDGGATWEKRTQGLTIEARLSPELGRDRRQGHALCRDRAGQPFPQRRLRDDLARAADAEAGSRHG